MLHQWNSKILAIELVRSVIPNMELEGHVQALKISLDL